MHLSVRLLATMVPILGLAMAACAPAEPDDSNLPPDNGDQVVQDFHVAVSGVALSHPLNDVVATSTGNAPDFSDLNIGVVNPSTILAAPSAPPLVEGVLENFNCAAAGVDWCFDAVDLDGISLGLVSWVKDRRAVPEWINTGTGFANAAEVEEHRQTKAPVDNGFAFGITKETEAHLATLVNMNPGDLLARGFFIGMIVGNEADSFSPVAGATLSIPSSEGFDIYYPNADLTTITGAETSTNGIVLAVPRAEGNLVMRWSVVPPMGDGRTWGDHIAGTNPNFGFVLRFPANEV